MFYASVTDQRDCLREICDCVTGHRDGDCSQQFDWSLRPTYIYLVTLRYIKIGDKEVEFHPRFRLILHTKLANPHYKPEMQAQTSLINFTVTIDGLEDQLLANVVRLERPDLEELKVGS